MVTFLYIHECDLRWLLFWRAEANLKIRINFFEHTYQILTRKKCKWWAIYRLRGPVRFVKPIFLKILTYNLKNHVSLGLSLALSITKDNSVRFEIRFLCFDWRLLRPAEISIWSRVKQSALFRSKETNANSQTQISQKREHPRKSMIF